MLHAGVGTASWAELSPTALQHPLIKTEWGHAGCWYHLLAPHRALHQLSCICKQSETRQQIPIQTQGSFKPHLLPACYGFITSRWWWVLLYLHLFESCAQPKSISHKGWYQPVLSLRYGLEIKHSAKAASLAGTLLQSQPQSSPKQLQLTCKCLSVMEGISCFFVLVFLKK